MPLFEYRCPSCTRVFEKLVSMSASTSQVACPACGGAAGKLVSMFAAIPAKQSAYAGMARTTAAGGCCGGGCCGGGS